MPETEHVGCGIMKRRLTAVMLAALAMLSACSKPLKTDAPMNSFSFSHSGMNIGLIYTLEAAQTQTGWQAELSLLAGEQEYLLDMTDAEASALAEIVQEHELNRWNGFDKVDKNALDGYDFELCIGYADGQKLYASGSNAFPEGYDAVHKEILEFFGKLMERNGIENPF